MAVAAALQVVAAAVAVAGVRSELLAEVEPEAAQQVWMAAQVEVLGMHLWVGQGVVVLIIHLTVG